MNIRWKAVVRDVVLITGLTFLGGLVVGMASTEQDFPKGALAVSNVLCLVVGFCISGCLVRTERFQHLLVVAMGVWGVGSLNLVVAPFTIATWIAGLVPTLLAMLVGGSLSLVVVRSPRPPPYAPPPAPGTSEA